MQIDRAGIRVFVDEVKASCNRVLFCFKPLTPLKTDIKTIRSIRHLLHKFKNCSNLRSAHCRGIHCACVSVKNAAVFMLDIRTHNKFEVFDGLGDYDRHRLAMFINFLAIYQKANEGKIWSDAIICSEIVHLSNSESSKTMPHRCLLSLTFRINYSKAQLMRFIQIERNAIRIWLTPNVEDVIRAARDWLSKAQKKLQRPAWVISFVNPNWSAC